MKRKIYNSLSEWKSTGNGKVAVLIDGARRVGKSWIAEEFAKNEYRPYIKIDFSSVSKDILELFEDYLDGSYLLSSKDLEIKDKLVYLPIYMAGLI